MMNGTTKLGHCQAMRWRDQALQEGQAWHIATGSLTAGNAHAYSAGYAEGYAAALADLRRHGFIEIDHNK